MQSQIKLNSIVQVNQNGKDSWVGCLIQVSEVKSWGVQGYVQLPNFERAYTRLTWDMIDYIGEAVMITNASEN